MKYWPVTCSWLPATAMALFPFMLFKNRKDVQNALLINHEKIHFQQQLEMLILPFYVFYLLNYLINLIRFRDHSSAYFNICFEKEAYAQDKNPHYLKQRRFYAWTKYL